jgi:phage-related protein
MEIVADEGRTTYRGMYTVRLSGVVYVLHVFKKKSIQGIKTPPRELDLIAKRLLAARSHYQQYYRIA